MDTPLFPPIDGFFFLLLSQDELETQGIEDGSSYLDVSVMGPKFPSLGAMKIWAPLWE